MNTIKSTSARLEDLCKIESKNMSETPDLSVQHRTQPALERSKVYDRDPHWYTRRVKEAIHIRLHPNHINRDNVIGIPEAWMPTNKKHNNRRTVRQRAAEGTTHRNSEDQNAPITAAENQPITAEHPA